MNIVKLRKYWYLLSLLIIIPGLISMGKIGFNKGIDFTGGSIIEVKFNKAVNSGDVSPVLNEMGLGDARIQTSTGNVVIIRTRDLSQTENDRLFNDLNQKVGSYELLRNDSVGPVIGKELQYKAILSLIIAFGLMILYITVRFEFRMGLAAVSALVHDILVTAGLVSLLGLEVDGAFIAALLTIVGYSINDTIVIFDRIRENLGKRTKDESLDLLIHHSIMQTLTRSINTVLTVVFCLLALIFFGGLTIKTFMIILLIGIVTGCYSSIFNAPSLWYDFRRLSKAGV